MNILTKYNLRAVTVAKLALGLAFVLAIFSGMKTGTATTNLAVTSESPTMGSVTEVSR